MQRRVFSANRHDQRKHHLGDIYVVFYPGLKFPVNILSRSFFIILSFFFVTSEDLVRTGFC